VPDKGYSADGLKKTFETQIIPRSHSIMIDPDTHDTLSPFDHDPSVTHTSHHKDEATKGMREMVMRYYTSETEDMLRGKKWWRKTGEFLEAGSKIMSGVASILAFAASSNISTPVSDSLAFSSGCIGTFSLVILTFSAYASKESRQRTVDLNKLLEKFEITPVPLLSAGTEIGDANGGPSSV